MLVVAALIFPAQGQDIRDVAQQRDADVTSSTSTGTDKHDLHTDTEKIDIRQHVPALLDSHHQPKNEKISEGEKKRLLEKRKQLLNEREAAGEKAASTTEAAAQAAGTPAVKIKASAQRTDSVGEERRSSSVIAERARKDAKRHWDATQGKQLAKIERELREGSTEDNEARFHAPALLNPK